MRPLLALLLLPLLAPLSGCLSCPPQLDVRHCLENNPVDCNGDGLSDAGDGRGPQADWNPDLAQLWPEIPRLMAKSMNGEHQHADWTENKAGAFWEFWHVPADLGEKQVFLRDQGETFRIRVLTCSPPSG